MLCPIGRDIQLCAAGGRSDQIQSGMAIRRALLRVRHPLSSGVGAQALERYLKWLLHGAIRQRIRDLFFMRECETSLSIPPQLCTSKNLLSSAIFSFWHSSATISLGEIANLVGRSIKSLEATAKQSDTPCVHHVDSAWLVAVSAAGLFTERWSKNWEGSHRTQPFVCVAGGRD